MTWLGNFSKLKEPTFKALDAVGESIGTARQVMEGDLSQSHKQIEANRGRPGDPAAAAEIGGAVQTVHP